MSKLPLPFGRLYKLRDFSYSNIKTTCIADSTLRLWSCTNKNFNQICSEGKIQIKKTGLARVIYARHLGEVKLNGYHID